jgi:hypothetical protein
MDEMSTVAGVGGYSTPLTSSKKTRKRNMSVSRKINKKKKKISERADMLLRDTIYKIIVEQNSSDKLKYILSMYDGISKRLGLSFNYARSFMIDAVKVEDVDGALKFNLKRAKAELRHVQKQIDDMSQLIDMVYKHSIENNIKARNDEIRKEQIAKKRIQRETR